jgi:hypothetical protein
MLGFGGEPCLASLRDKVPSSAGYVHEVKLDGYRVQAHLRDGRVTLFTRSGLDWTKRFPTIAADIARSPAGKGASWERLIYSHLGLFRPVPAAVLASFNPLWPLLNL